MHSREGEKRVMLICFLAIPVILMGLFVVYPAIDMILISFTDWDGSSASRKFIGLGNYIEILTLKPEVWLSLRNNLIYMILALVFIPIEILFAVMLNKTMKGLKGFKTLYFLPYIINGVAISYIFAFFYSPVNGGLNGLLTAMGLKDMIRNWLSDVKIVNYSLAVVYLWRNFGFFIVLFIAGLQTISKDIIEAAIIDGASGAQRLRYIILPGIRRVIEIVVFMNLTWCLQIFDIPFVMTSGGPGYASSTFSTYAIEAAFRYNNFGLANAMSILLVGMIVLILVTQRTLTKKERRIDG